MIGDQMNIKPRKLTSEELEWATQYLYWDEEPLMILSSDSRSFGESLRIKRVADGYTQVQLARKLKMSPSVLSDIEREVREVPSSRAKALYNYVYKELHMYGNLEYRIDDDDARDTEYYEDRFINARYRLDLVTPARKENEGDDRNA